MPDSTNRRVAYLDWMRGLACVLMFQTHCYDSWLGAPARNTQFFLISQLGGSLPAPLFLFLAGVSAALVTAGMRQKGVADRQVARKVIARGAEVFAFGLIFRLQEFVLGQPGAPWTDLLRVDVLNTIGLSLVMLGVTCRLAAFGLTAPVSADRSGVAFETRTAKLRTRSVALGAAGAATIAILTPPLWTSHRLHWLPWYLESYISGVHTYGAPQTWLFPLFPWAAFAFAGLAAGFLLLSPWAKRHELKSVLIAGAAGVLLIAFGLWLDARPLRLYASYDFWHTSPNFFMVRVGVLLALVLASYSWCRWGAGQWGFSPFIQLGQASLLVYWVHIEFVYGRFSILHKHGMGIFGASVGLAIIVVAMTLLAVASQRFNRRESRPRTAGATATGSSSSLSSRVI